MICIRKNSNICVLKKIQLTSMTSTKSYWAWLYWDDVLVVRCVVLNGSSDIKDEILAPVLCCQIRLLWSDDGGTYCTASFAQQNAKWGLKSSDLPLLVHNFPYFRARQAAFFLHIKMVTIIIFLKIMKETRWLWGCCCGREPSPMLKRSWMDNIDDNVVKHKTYS